MTANNLPQYLTPFIGREREITDISNKLQSEDCRLFTLAGPGGSGKTRLAIEVARQVDFADGSYFVPLQPLQSADNIVTAIIDGLPLQLHDSSDPRQHLLNYLQTKDLLLVLDNFEHLLDGVDIVTDILAKTACATLLVTSRERLNLQVEHVWPVLGLDVPDSADDITHHHSAVELFFERAQRLQPDFNLNSQGHAVIRICQLVDGLPLALELAATWVRVLPCDAIADEIQRNIDILTSPHHDISKRHRSMRAVFNYSWRRLSDDERKVFQRLTVFRAGFTPDAAEHVAESSVEILRSLAGKSLLWLESSSHRYSIHELLRQYAEEHLHQVSNEANHVRERHCTYFMDFLHQHAPAIRGGRQREASDEIWADRDNVSAAWQWAVDQRRIEALDKAAYTLELSHQYKSAYLECAQLLARAVNALDANALPQTRAHLLNMLGWISIRLSRFEASRVAFQNSLDIMDRAGLVPRPGRATDPLPGLSLIASIQGDHETATRLGLDALEQSEARGDQGNIMMSSYVLVSTFFAQGNYDEAQRHAQQAYDLAAADEDYWFMALSLNDLGKIARVQGNYDIAERHHWSSYNISQGFGDKGGMAGSLIHLGNVALSQHDHAKASTYFSESLVIYQDIGDAAGLASTLSGLGQIAFLEMNDSDAQQYYERALQTASKSGLVPLMLSVLKSMAQYHLHGHRSARTIILLSMILRHPSINQETQDSAHDLLRAAKETLQPAEGKFTALSFHGRHLELEDVVTKLQLNFNHPFEDDIPQSTAKSLLSDRELEVLQLVAVGASNQQIAHKLGLSDGTVRSTHVFNIYRKLDVKNRTEAVARARELGLLY